MVAKYLVALDLSTKLSVKNGLMWSIPDLLRTRLSSLLLGKEGVGFICNGDEVSKITSFRAWFWWFDPMHVLKPC